MNQKSQPCSFWMGSFWKFLTIKTKFQPEKSNILTSFALTLIAGTLIRTFFILMHGDFYTALDVILPLLVGVMIDSYVLSFFFLPICFSFLAKKSSFSTWVFQIYLQGVISLFLLLSMADVFFFSIYRNRLNIYRLEQALDLSFWQLFSMIYSEFPYGLLIFPFAFLLGYLLSRWAVSLHRLEKAVAFPFGIQRHKKKISNRLLYHFGLKSRLKLVVFHFLFFFIVGSLYLSPKTLWNFSEASSEKLFLQIASINTPFNFMESIQLNRILSPTEKFKQMVKKHGIKPPKDHPFFMREKRMEISNPALKTKPHIILINVDSLSQILIDPAANSDDVLFPYLHQIARKGLNFTNFYYHWQSSFASYQSIFYGFPSIEGGLLPKQTQKKSLINVLKQLGYKSFFIQGTISMDEFLKKAGFDKIIDPRQFAHIKRTKQQLIPVADKEIADRAFEEIKQHKDISPVFMTLVFNALHLDDHPSTDRIKDLGFKDRYPVFENSPYSEKLQKKSCYLNWVIENFITRLSTLISNKNFIVMITGEHRFWGRDLQYNNLSSLQPHQVPFLVLDQRNLIVKKGIHHKVGGHADLPITLLYMIGYDGGHSFMGQNLLDVSKDGYALFSDDLRYYYRQGVYLLEYAKYSEKIKIYQINASQIRTPVNNPVLKRKMEKDFKAYLAGLGQWLETDY